MHPKELQTLIGTLKFVCKVIPPPPGDPFCSVWLSSLAKSLNHTIILSKQWILKGSHYVATIYSHVEWG